MPRTLPEAPEGKFCVAVARYFTSRIEAESEFLKMKDVPNVAVDFYERDEAGEWEETDWSGYPGE